MDSPFNSMPIPFITFGIIKHMKMPSWDKFTTDGVPTSFCFGIRYWIILSQKEENINQVFRV
jgi:hypothetical protein